MKFKYVHLDQVAGLPAALRMSSNVHPNGLSTALKRFGILKPVYVNRATAHVLNPVELAAIASVYTPDAAVPVVVLDIPAEDEVAAALVIAGGLDGMLNPLPADDEAVSEAIYRLLDADPAHLEALAPLDYIQNLLYAGAGQPRLEGLTWDIPMLDINLQVDDPTQRFIAWGSRRRDAPAHGIHFYVDDYRFSSVFDKPEAITATGCKAVIETNISTIDDQPGALFIADLWKKRRLSRVLQAQGVRVVVDVNVARRFLPYALMGVPTGWRAYANRAYIDDLDHLDEAYQLAQSHAGTDILYFVWGGGKAVKALCKARGWVYLGDVNSRYGTRNKA